MHRGKRSFYSLNKITLSSSNIRCGTARDEPLTNSGGYGLLQQEIVTHAMAVASVKQKTLVIREKASELKRERCKTQGNNDRKETENRQESTPTAPL